MLSHAMPCHVFSFTTPSTPCPPMAAPCRLHDHGRTPANELQCRRSGCHWYLKSSLSPKDRTGTSLSVLCTLQVRSALPRASRPSLPGSSSCGPCLMVSFCIWWLLFCLWPSVQTQENFSKTLVSYTNYWTKN